MARPNKTLKFNANIHLLLSKELKTQLSKEGKELGLDLNAYIRMLLKVRNHGIIEALLENAQTSKRVKK